MRGHYGKFIPQNDVKAPHPDCALFRHGEAKTRAESAPKHGGVGAVDAARADRRFPNPRGAPPSPGRNICAPVRFRSVTPHLFARQALTRQAAPGTSKEDPTAKPCGH